MGHLDQLYFDVRNVNTEYMVIEQDPWPLVPHNNFYIETLQRFYIHNIFEMCPYSFRTVPSFRAKH
jgi:hypothetical protein